MLIKVTDNYNGYSYSVNINKIQFYYSLKNNNSALIILEKHTLEVKETPEEIDKLIEEKLKGVTTNEIITGPKNYHI